MSSTNNNKSNSSSRIEDTKQIRRFGWVPDIPNQRDHLYQVEEVVVTLPPKVDLRKDNGGPDSLYPIFDQGELGSCTGNAISEAFAVALLNQLIKENKSTVDPFLPSRLFIYYNERVIERSVNYDSGAMIRDGVKSINKTGVCSEITWPYKISKFKTRPTSAAFTEALNHQSLKYQRIDNTNLTALKSCLASGYPFVFGFTVYSSFQTNAVYKTGMVPMPKNNEGVEGGHAVLCVGYDDSNQRFICRNSWGKNWADKGYFYMPYAYLTNTNLSDDFWESL